MKVHIVIPCYNHYELTNQILSLRQKESGNIYSVLVMDDSSDEDISGLSWWEKEVLLPLQVFTRIVNMDF